MTTDGTTRLMQNENAPATASAASNSRKVMVAGCFDLLHPSHLLFLNKAAAFGKLYVSLGSDRSILLQKQRSPNFNENERKYMLENLRCVEWVGIVADPGPLGFREHLEQIRPDLFVINQDGHSDAKQALVESFGIEYRVFDRDVSDLDRPTSTTEISQRGHLPTRISLCSGFVDNPGVSAFAGAGGASLVVVPIEPLDDLQERSGMATSTLATVRKYFGSVLPTKYSARQLGEMIFCLENPPHKHGYVSGTLDSLGILSRGICRFTYAAGQYFPDQISAIDDEATAGWFEERAYLRHSWQRPTGYEVTINPGHPQFPYHCRRMYDASARCWEALQQRNFEALCAAVNLSREAQTQAVSGHCPAKLSRFISDENASAAMIMGAGGGGYVLFLNESIPEDAIRIRVRRGQL